MSDWGQFTLIDEPKPLCTNNNLLQRVNNYMNHKLVSSIPAISTIDEEENQYYDDMLRTWSSEIVPINHYEKIDRNNPAPKNIILHPIITITHGLYYCFCKYWYS